MSATKIVTDASFADDVLLSDKPVIVDFWAEWTVELPTFKFDGKQIIGAKPKAALIADLSDYLQ